MLRVKMLVFVDYFDFVRERELDIFHKVILPLTDELGFSHDIEFYVSW